MKRRSLEKGGNKAQTQKDIEHVINLIKLARNLQVTSVKDGKMMHNLKELDNCFKKFINQSDEYLPDGLTPVDIDLLHRLNLLNYYKQADGGFTRYFQVVETDEKITLINEQFIVWILSEKIDNTSSTFIFIAINKPEEPHLEIAFSVSGVYNTSKLVLRLLEHYLQEIQDTEESLDHIKED